MNILILYRELAGYTVECLNKLASHHKLLVVHYPINEEAPFNFQFTSSIQLATKSEVTFKKISNFNPAFVLCSGWGDKEYLEWLKELNRPTAIAFDTTWSQSIKFILGSLYFKLKYKKLFQFAFIPGNAQAKTASKLGFSTKQTLDGFYTCEDTFRLNRTVLTKSKELWCVARYIQAKNINFLCETFLSIPPNERSGWKLNLAGTGELFSSRIENEDIIHHGFLQPNELSKKLENATAFVLPSLYEPWGVVVHEMASLGKPLLLSTAVGAKQDLLEEGMNGYSFDPASSSELKKILLTLFQSSHEELLTMGNKSSEMASKFSSDYWVSQFTKMLEQSCAE
ncbi:MAG: glycosyltransferase [Flavobacteriales bacterium]|jgi:glycosyltransferase involved in cell wall biosynthesis